MILIFESTEKAGDELDSEDIDLHPRTEAARIRIGLDDLMFTRVA